MTLAIRIARPDDVGTILGFIRELAEYEKLAHEVVADEAKLRATLFAPDRLQVAPGTDKDASSSRPPGTDKDASSSRPEVLIAELAGDPVGFALFFTSYSTFLAKPGLYLEDLFVRPAARGQGVGLALMAAIARIAVDRDYGRFEWSVLDWNTPALEFYARLGARPQGEWTVQRLTGEPLVALATRASALR